MSAEMAKMESRWEVLGKAWLPKPPSGYVYPDPAALQMIGFAAQAAVQGRSRVNPNRLRAALSERNFASQFGGNYVLEQWILGNGPTFYPTTDLLELCMRTDVLHTVNGSDIRTVVPSGLFCFPIEFANKHLGGVTHVLFGIIEPGINITSHSLRTSGAVVEGARCLFCNFFDQKGDGGFLTSAHLNDRPIADIGREVVRNGENAGWQGACILIFNLLLIMQSYPQYVSRMNERESERLAYGDRKTTPRPYSARIARPIQRAVAMTPKPHSDKHGTHKPPKMHWRSGHWRRQHHSPQWEVAFPDVKCIDLEGGIRAHMVWIEPALVNAEEATDGK